MDEKDTGAVPEAPAQVGSAGQTMPVSVSPARELLRFSTTRPLWQQHLIRCLFVDGEARSSDIEDAYQMLLVEHHVTEAPAAVAVPLGPRDVPPRQGPQVDVVLQSLGPTIQVNRLVDSQIIPFAIDGLTVVYGENASGKSGYVRVLKSLCRTQGSQEQVLPDVLDADNAGIPSGRVRFRVAGQPTEYEWRQGEDSPPELSSISVFDARRAVLYSDGERRLEFLPAGLDVLGKLGETLTALAARIDRASAALRQNLPTVLLNAPITTSTGTLIARLAEGQSLPTVAELDAAAELSADEEAELRQLEAVFAVDARTSAPRMDGLANALENLAQRVTDLEAALGDAALGRLGIAMSRATEARDAALLAAETALAPDSLLREVGSEPWRLMFRYAREYLAIAVPDGSFPPEAPDGRCPFCQQLLSAEASDRLKHFSEFVLGRAEQEATRLELEVATALRSVEGLIVPSVNDVEAVIAAVEPLMPSAIPHLNATANAFVVAAARRANLLAKPPVVAPAIDWPQNVASQILEDAARFNAIASKYRSLIADEERRTSESRLDELRARGQLAPQIANARLRLELLDRLTKLSECRKACDTSSISRKNSDLRRAFLTADFELRLRTEFTALDLEHLPLRVGARSLTGQSLVSVSIDTPLRVTNRDVLSEGESRGLALACFLAEVRGLPGTPPMVLDDPVSSLDHARTERVAKRLVGEVRNGRQVIVFTHSLVFFHELWMRASQEQVPTTTHWLVRASNEPGYVKVGEQPWEVQEVKTRLGELEQRLATAKRFTDRSADGYRAAVTHFHTGIRETWERLVEEQLLGDVVQRYRLSVETRRLGSVEVTDDDYATVFFAMSRASEFSGHDRAVARQLAVPSPDDMSADLDELRAYHQVLKQRSNRLVRQRAALHRPPAGHLEIGA